MILDSCGTEYRSGRIILPKDWIFRPVVPQWWEPQGDKTHYKIVARGIGGAILWQGNFTDLAKAMQFWQSLQEIGPAPHEWDLPFPSWHPSLLDPSITYYFATVVSFTSVGTTSWSVPVGVTATDYLTIAGAGGGGASQDGAGLAGGGGGAGGFLSGLAKPVTPGGSYSAAVGDGGNGSTTGSDTPGSNGSNSVFDTETAIGGGGGAYGLVGRSGSNGGSGGGAAPSGSAGTATVGQGNNGGTSTGNGAAGGGGATSVGSPNSGNVGGNGGTGASNSISGSPVTYATGGKGGTFGGNIPIAGAANTGNGGGGASGTTPGANGGSGVVVLSFTAKFSALTFRRNTRFFTRRF